MADGKTSVTATSVSLLTTQKAVKVADDEQTAQKNVLEGALGAVENVSLDEAAVTLTSLQTQLQAMYQLTAKLSSLSLANYL